MHCASLFFFSLLSTTEKTIKVKYCINYKNMRYAHPGLVSLHAFGEVQ